GLLGWDRVSGTFPEPHSLGTYLAACLPLCVLVAQRSIGRRRVAARVGVWVLVATLLLTVTVPAWLALAAGAPVGAVLYAGGRGWTGPAAIAGATLVLGALAVPVIESQPSLLSAI